MIEDLNKESNHILNMCRILYEIYAHELRGERIWLGKLYKIFRGKIDENGVVVCEDMLNANGFTEYAYGETENGRVGVLIYTNQNYKLSPNIISFLFEVYESTKFGNKVDIQELCDIIGDSEHFSETVLHKLCSCSEDIGYLEFGMKKMCQGHYRRTFSLCEDVIDIIKPLSEFMEKRKL